MSPVARSIFASMAAIAILLTGGDATACQPPPVMLMQEKLDEAIAVVRAKVMAAEVITVADLGRECVSVICDVLEVRLDIREVFKGSADDYVIIHAAVPTMCVTPIIPGWEYLLFLEEFEGSFIPNRYSVITGSNRTKTELIELRSLTVR